MWTNEQQQEIYDKEIKNHPAAIDALKKVMNSLNDSPLYFKIEDKLLCVIYADVKCIFNEELASKCEKYFMWRFNIWMHKGEPRLAIELIDPRDAEICRNMGINYFPKLFLLEDYGKTWSDKEF